MVSSLSSSMSRPQISQEMQAKFQKMESFKSGKTNLSKDDLTEMASDIQSHSKNGEIPDDLKQIIDNYSKIDSNGDGEMSMDELKSFASENNMELKGPFGDKGGPGGPGGPPPGPPPDGQGGSSGGGLSISSSSKSSSNSLASQLISNYFASDSQQSYSNFSLSI